jgi:isopenicillin-N epimerase
MKNLFLLEPSLVFLNHGSFGACPAAVFAIYQGWQREMERNPVEFLGRRSAELLAEARSELARFLGAKPEHVVFLSNATGGVNTVARSLPLSVGDEILTTDHEYGACDYTWDFVCQRTGSKYVSVNIPLPFRSEEFVDRIWAGVTPRTKVIFLSHITSTTALVFPIAELCRRARKAGILTLIDGAHAPGHIPLNLEELGADFYTGNCHKWLCAPKGSAFLHARPEHHHLLNAPVVSWGYSAEIEGHAPYAGTALLERRLQWQGTRDLAAFLSVPAAIAFQEQNDWEQVRRSCHELAVTTLERICSMTGLPPVCHRADFGQMVVIPVPPMDPVQLKGLLFDQHHIEIPVTMHKERLFVRISIQGYNTPRDADALVSALKDIYKL